MSLNEIVGSASLLTSPPSAQWSSFDNARFNNLTIDGDIRSSYFTGEDGYMLQINQDGLAVFAPPPITNIVPGLNLSIGPYTATNVVTPMPMTLIYSTASSFATFAVDTITMTTNATLLVLLKMVPNNVDNRYMNQTIIGVQRNGVPIQTSFIYINSLYRPNPSIGYFNAFIYSFNSGDLITVTCSAPTLPGAIFTNNIDGNNITLLRLA